MEINKEEVRKVDLSEYAGLIGNPTHHEYWLEEAGKEHYKLLAYISKNMPKGSVLADLGSREGISALALSVNPDVKVVSYDIDLNRVFRDIKDGVTNVEWIEKNVLDDIENIAKCDFIFLDIDPHDGGQEQDFLEAIKAAGYEGMLVCDDIDINTGMRNFWTHVEDEKENVTDIGHWSGTGIIFLKKEEKSDKSE